MKKNKRKLGRYLPLYLMALPGMVYLIINNYMPLPGLVLAFKKYSAKKGIFGSKFVGLKNFKYPAPLGRPCVSGRSLMPK